MSFMNILKTICRTAGGLVRQAVLLPRSLSITAKLKRRQASRHEVEAERLDRIRNPWKYLGK